MKVCFKKAVRYSEDGHAVLHAEKGEVREVAHSTACALICGRIVDNIRQPELGKADICNVD